MKWLLSFIFLSSVSYAYIPPTRVILEKVSDNAGKAFYQVERNVRFSNPEIPILHESWSVESERALRLTVTPITRAGDAPLPKLTFLYVKGLKYWNSNGSKVTGKISDEMLERFFHFKHSENLIQLLKQLGIISTAQGNLDLARLNRSQGVVTYGIGRPTDAGSRPTSPYLWVGQDTFLIRKIRFSENTELIANDYENFPKGLSYPMILHLNWSDQKVKMNTLSVSLVKKFKPTVFQSSQLEDIRPFENAFSRWSEVIEFYKRFR